MRVSYVIPGAMSQGPLGVEEIRRRQVLLGEWAFSGTEVTVVDTPNGVTSIESAYEELLAAPGAIDRIRELEREGVDAAIIGCFGDPGLEAARELVSIPVIGPGEASLLLAAHLGHRITILSVFDSLAASHRQQAFRAGVLDKLASVRGLGIPVLELTRDQNATVARIVEVGRRAVEEDRAEVLICGCMTMSFLGVAPRLSQVLGVPVVNAAQAALKAAETLVSINLSHSKKAFPLPPKLQGATVAAGLRAN
jgi:allantoin racemase